MLVPLHELLVPKRIEGDIGVGIAVNPNFLVIELNDTQLLSLVEVSPDAKVSAESKYVAPLKLTSL